MYVEVYAFEFNSKEYENINFREYAKEMIYNRFCKPFCVFNKINSYRFVNRDFISQVNKGIQKLIQDFYLKNVDFSYYFTVYRIVDENKKIDRLEIV